MKPKQQRKVIKKSTDVFHLNDNVDKLLEEMSELQFALLKLRRNPESKKRLKDVQGELADVKMALEINIDLFDRKKVTTLYRLLINKLKKKIK